jgi:hypothetical protein
MAAPILTTPPSAAKMTKQRFRLVYRALFSFIVLIVACFGLGFAFLSFGEAKQKKLHASAIKKHVSSPKGWSELALPRADMRLFVSPDASHKLTVSAERLLDIDTPYGDCTEYLLSGPH